jgi:hypothetical protein
MTFRNDPARFFAVGTKKKPRQRAGLRLAGIGGRGEAPAGGENDEKVAVE